MGLTVHSDAAVLSRYHRAELNSTIWQAFPPNGKVYKMCGNLSRSMRAARGLIQRLTKLPLSALSIGQPLDLLTGVGREWLRLVFVQNGHCLLPQLVTEALATSLEPVIDPLAVE